MTADALCRLLVGQTDAALCMLRECIRDCPDAQWDGLIVKYPFWQAAYHVLCFFDLDMTPHEKDFKTGPMHPRGMQELDDEYPSRRFDKAELLDYLDACRRKMHAALAGETDASLAGPSGHSRLTFTRAEMYIHNIRHIQHHTAQLIAFLRQAGMDPRWMKTGWR